MDPALQIQRQQQAQKRREEQLQEERERLRQQAVQLISQIQQQMIELQQANQRAAEQKQADSLERYMNQLTYEQRLALAQRAEAASKQAKQQIQDRNQPPPPPPLDPEPEPQPNPGPSPQPEPQPQPQPGPGDPGSTPDDPETEPDSDPGDPGSNPDEPETEPDSDQEPDPGTAWMEDFPFLKREPTGGIPEWETSWLTYKGVVVGAAADETPLTGNILFDIDSSVGKLSGEMTFDDSEGSVLFDGRLDESGSINAQTSYDGTFFNGTVAANQSDAVRGFLYGPGGENAGGIWSFDVVEGDMPGNASGQFGAAIGELEGEQ